MFLTLDDARLFTTAFGPPTAPVLLGIGGWIGSWELWAGPFSLLSADWYTIAYDHRGAGATLAPTESITFERLVDDVIGRPHLYDAAEIHYGDPVCKVAGS